jgi:hypothetical protein
MSKSCCCSNPGVPESVPCSKTTKDRDGVPEISSKLQWKDKLGTFNVRWGIGRMNYSLPPGLYRIGKPDENSPVLVTANYKLTVDSLRKELGGMHAWILILNTHGINVWCAAGKGTFGTDELVRQIENCSLKSLVAHREIILPQLGAPGMAAHEVRKLTGFRVVYGPVYAKDIPAFIANGKRATTDMRRVHFHLSDRIVLIPMELIPALKWVPAIIGMILVMRLAEGSRFDVGILKDIASYLGAVLVGTTIFQIMVPWIPGRSFAWKGWFLGMLWALSLMLWLQPAFWIGISNLLVLPMITAYLALNFTGSTTFTSLSGVQKELRIAAPAMIASVGLGLILRIASRLLV